MSHNDAPLATLSTVARFPKNHFLENLVVRADNSIIVTTLNNGRLWFVPAQWADEEVTPVQIFEFSQNSLGIVEIEPEVLLIMCCDFYTFSSGAFAYKLDLRGWKPGDPVHPKIFFRFPSEARGLNGCCLLSPDVLLVADSFAGLIWRLHLPAAGEPSARVWLADESMGYYPGKMQPEQPGVNGVRFSERSSFLYYSSTARKLFMRVAVDPTTLEPAGKPELVVAGRMGDDFCIDEDAKVVYLTTHRQNTLDVVSMDPGDNSGFTQSVAGDPFDGELIGPSNVAWRRGAGDYGKVLFMTADGGTASPLPSGKQAAKLFKVALKPLGKKFPGAK